MNSTYDVIEAIEHDYGYSPEIEVVYLKKPDEFGENRSEPFHRVKFGPHIEAHFFEIKCFHSRFNDLYDSIAAVISSRG
ncbi:hypothetical protein MYO4S_00035 [Serratia phage 4S]|nr:hypothetical protein MYO4S_00035 [Serratia phage 4S]